MATAAELRRLREEQSIFAPLYEAARQQQSNLSAANASPLGGLLAQSGANQQSGPVAPNLIDEYLKSLQARR